MGKGVKPYPYRMGKASKKNEGVAERERELIPKQTSAPRLTAPRGLTPGARKEWRRIVKLYSQMDVNILTDLDTQMLAAYCMEVDIRDTLYKKWVEEQNCEVLTDAERSEVSKESVGGVEVRQRKSLSKTNGVNPILAQINKHNQTIRVLAEQLGLTPVGRAAYAVRAEKKARNKAEELMDFFDGDADGDGDGYRGGYGALS